MSGDNVIKIMNNAVIPEIMERSGEINLYFGDADDRESIEIKGSITLSEVCFLHMLLGRYINKKMNEFEND